MRFIALGIVLLLAACAPQGILPVDQQADFGDHLPQELTQDVSFMVTLSPGLVDDHDELCRELDEQAWTQGAQDLLHLFVSDQVLVRPGKNRDHGSISAANARPMLCDLWQDPVTGIVSQAVRMRATFSPERRYAGLIQSLQDNQTMGGMLSRAYVSLENETIMPLPIPVLIVQQSSHMPAGMMQVIGSGLLTQVTDTMGQMVIVESTQEIFPGDLFFQIRLQAETVPLPAESLPLSPGDAEEWVEIETVAPVSE